jgi:small-conductance mechanosensitive channel
MDKLIWGNPVSEWLIAIGIAVATFLLLGALKRFVVFRLGKWAEKTETDVDDMLIDLVKRTKLLYLLVFGLWCGSHYLKPTPEVYYYIHLTLKVATLLQAALWCVGVVDYGVGKLTKGTSADPGKAMGAHVLGLIGRALVWTAIGLMLLSLVMHETITTLVTGLGVGGIAVALALQNVLGDLFASISILLDKPFVLGDSIVVGEFNGTVEHIGIKTTRLKSVNGEQLIMGNADLAHSRIRNFKRLQERRSVFTIGVTYQTPREKLEQIPAMLKEIIEKTHQARFERAHFAKFGDWALVFEAAYFVQHPDYQSFMDAQQAVNFELLKRFEKEGIAFAYPTQTVLQAPLQSPLKA